jgi:YVTN family beta-propeller protein
MHLLRACRAGACLVALGICAWLVVPCAGAAESECVYAAVRGRNRLVVVDATRRTVRASIVVSGERPHDVAVVGAKAYVVAVGPFPPAPSTVSVVDLTRQTETTVVPVGSYPNAIAASPDGGSVYVTNFADNTVSVIDTRIEAVVSTIALPGRSPNSLSMSPDGSRVYMTFQGSPQLMVLENGEVVDQIGLPHGALASVYYPRPEGDLLLVAGSGRISAVDLARRRVDFTIEDAGLVSSMAVDPQGGRLYWGHHAVQLVAVWDLVTQSLVKVIDVDPRPFRFELDVSDVALSGDRRYLYASLGSWISVVNLQTLRLAAAIQIDDGAPFGLTVAPCPPDSPLPTPSPTPTPMPGLLCAGDCNGDGRVSVDEVLAMMEIAFGNALLESCPAGDANEDGVITVDEILTAVRHVMEGCARDCRDVGCPLGMACGCCCGAWACLPPLAICCALAC